MKEGGRGVGRGTDTHTCGGVYIHVYISLSSTTISGG